MDILREPQSKKKREENNTGGLKKKIYMNAFDRCVLNFPLLVGSDCDCVNTN